MEETKKIIGAYSCHAAELAQKYERYDRSVIFSGLADLLTPERQTILDIGAGAGIDAHHFALTGRRVTAVEPSDLLLHAQKTYNHPNILWMRDELPELGTLVHTEGQYDLVFLNRVFMHLPPNLQDSTIGRLERFLSESGVIYMVIRHGPSHDERVMYPVDLDQLKISAKNAGLRYQQLADVPDHEGRANVSWSTVLMTR